MTTVYGVTKYGARLQIGRQLKERGMPDSQAVIARTYLADSTFHCLQQMFASAKQIQVSRYEYPKNLDPPKNGSNHSEIGTV